MVKVGGLSEVSLNNFDVIAIINHFLIRIKELLEVLFFTPILIIYTLAKFLLLKQAKKVGSFK